MNSLDVIYWKTTLGAQEHDRQEAQERHWEYQKRQQLRRPEHRRLGTPKRRRMGRAGTSPAEGAAISPAGGVGATPSGLIRRTRSKTVDTNTNNSEDSNGLHARQLGKKYRGSSTTAMCRCRMERTYTILAPVEYAMTASNSDQGSCSDRRWCSQNPSRRQ